MLKMNTRPWEEVVLSANQGWKFLPKNVEDMKIMRKRTDYLGKTVCF